MNDIKCPHCGKIFKVDGAGFANILKQVRDSQFEKEIHDRLENAEREKQDAVKLAEADIRNKARDVIAKKDSEISEMKSKIDNADLEKRLAVKEALNPVEKERDDFKAKLQNKENEIQIREASMKSEYETKLNSKDEVIERYKDMKIKLSTKMVGETLEEHCEIEFNKLRATAFQNAYFEKDNDSRTGSKGDYIYRETDELGNEIISIMFEMKNEGDETATKKKNEDFLSELDKDRVEKKCEYAVLVSLLEIDNDLYNTGIVDVSHRYSKMYVIRPQFFITLITLLRNAAMKSLKYKAELAIVKNQNIDITNFEENISKFKEAFSKNSKLYYGHFDTAIGEIDKTISHLQKTKDELVKSVNNLRLANTKVEDLSIKRLTRGNATMIAKFAEVSNTNKGAETNE